MSQASDIGNLGAPLSDKRKEASEARTSWLSGGGEMGELIRSMDWSETPLGAPETWPQSLRTTVSLCLSSTFPILIAWGPERVQLYNDSYRPIAGAKHPRSMGQRFNDCWASALPAVGGVVDRAQAGEGSYIENLRMFLDRHGYLEEAFMTFSFSPIRDESGRVGGLFHPITEVTEKMLGARRTQVLRELAAQLGKAKTLEEVWDLAAHGYDAYCLDLPFLLFYRREEDGAYASLLGAAGLARGGPGAPARIELAEASEQQWPLQRSLRSREIEEVTDLDRRFGTLRCGPYAEPPRSALVLPIHPPGASSSTGCLIAGVSARRALDGPYRAFYETLAATFTTAVSNVRAYEQEQKRAEELAALDRAKTAFFSNVSHEFRTPLTLILGPTEDALASADQALRGANLATVYRNELRLLKLVNTLLDFSRIEAGREQVSYEPTDLAAVTRDLASSFRSLVERGGLRLTVDCESLPEPVWVDQEMWEKIVLNLLSNAFKFTFEGQIAVSVRKSGDHVALSVADSGTGIPQAELPRLFERFHRVEGSRGRSYEGSGIGLALVQELVRLHGGRIDVVSTLGRGTTFTVSLPLGNSHLPNDRIQAGRTLVSTATRAEAFVREASAWLNLPPEQTVPSETQPEAGAASPSAPIGPSSTPPAATTPRRVLVVDDNSDMRDYVKRLLEPRFTVEAVADGHAALKAVRAHPTDLILSDVMMPGLDGFALLRELKADPNVRDIPVILLSARAGDEARIEGIQAGASDYIVKPFSARELVARVEGGIEVAKARSRLSEVLESMGDAFYVVDRDWRFVLVNASHERMTCKPRSETLGKSIWDVFPEAAATNSRYWTELRRGMEHRLPVRFIEHYGPLDLWTDVRAYPTTDGLAVFFRDVSEERRAEEGLKRQAEFEQQLVGIVSHDLRNPLNAIQIAVNILLRRDSQDERTTKTLRRIASSTERATRLVRDLLDFTQARLGGGIPIERTPLDFHALARQVLEEVHAGFPERDLIVETVGDGHGTWDADRIAQLVTNLVVNAFKYSPVGTPVSVHARGSGATVELRVHNKGTPIPVETLGRIFEPLQRGSAAGDKTERSVGLGLYIVKQIAGAHGGTIEVSSTEEDGTTFAVCLPRREISPETQECSDATSAASNQI